MNNDIQDVIHQADLLIKEGKYKSAWNLLLPHKSDPEARKRLVWLEKKRQRASQEVKKVSTEPNSSRRIGLFAVIAVVIILGIGSLIILNFSKQNAASPTTVAETTQDTVISTATAFIVPTIVPSATPTAIPPTEDLKEVSLQQKLRDWLSGVNGVDHVLSFDVDMPGNEAPLAYVEVVVKQGYNDTHIPDQVLQKLDDELNTKDYSDFSIIMSDGSTTTEYDLDAKSHTWNQTVLSFTAVPAD
jgi:cytoskeletal protein RodZ